MNIAEPIEALEESRQEAGRAYSFFALLTPARAFALFAVALGTSAAVLWLGDQHLAPYLALIPILAYGSALVLAQVAFKVQLSGTVTDSPYFLGFILTMLALARIFVGVADNAGNVQIAVVVGEAGGAILATVIGLFLRQLLMSLDPAEDARDAVFQSIAAELREHAVEFHETQLRFVGLVKEFTKARERLFVREEAAQTRYLERLEAGGAILSQLEEGYPARVQSLLLSVERARDSWAQSVQANASQLADFRTQMNNAVEMDAASLRGGVAELITDLSASRSALTDNIRLAAEELGTLLPQLSAQVRLIAASFESAPNVGKELAKTVASLAQETIALRAEVGALLREHRSMASAVADITAALRGEASELQSSVAVRASGLQRELQAIDDVMEEFVAVMRAHVRTAAPTR